MPAAIKQSIMDLPIEQRPVREVARGRWVELNTGSIGIVFETAKSFQLEDETFTVGALIHLTDDEGLTVGETVARYQDITVLYPDDPRIPEARRH